MVGSSPTLGTICLFGETDIIFVFETKVVGSIPARGTINIRMDYNHDDYVKFIQQMVESVCPYNEEQKRSLYHEGFLAGYLAKVLEKDPYNLHEFKRHVEHIKKTKKSL